jgi:hypothetical protein
MLFVYKKVKFAAALAVTVIFVGIGGQAAAQSTDERLYVVTHVDVLGQSGAAEAAKMLHQFAIDSRNDPGWRTRQDFESHLAASHTRAFREKLQPMLGSPFDERLHKLLP